MRRHLTYANVTATVALFVALGGGAYAISGVGSKDIRDNAVRSVDLRNGSAVRGQDVQRNSLGASAIDEKSLDASRLVKLAGGEGPNCDPDSAVDYLDCAKVNLQLSRTARLFVVATGNQESVGAVAAAAACDVRIDDVPAANTFAPGESTSANTDSTATNGFARTLVTPDPLPPGKHKVSLACAELAGDVKIDVPTIAAIAINEP